MKYDELTAYNVVATADVNPEVVDSLGCTEWAGYDKADVDAAIAELKAKLAEKESDNKSALKAVSHWHDNYCELQKVVDRLQSKLECKEDKYKKLVKDHDKAIQACCDADKRIVRLQRALWIARALALSRFDVDEYLMKYTHCNSRFWDNGYNTFNEACEQM